MNDFVLIAQEGEIHTKRSESHQEDRRHTERPGEGFQGTLPEVLLLDKLVQTAHRRRHGTGMFAGKLRGRRGDGHRLGGGRGHRVCLSGCQVKHLQFHEGAGTIKVAADQDAD